MPDGCRIVMPICYRHIAQMADTTTNYQLMPGDRIYVATRTLCEQLMFWEDKKSCEFCKACQSGCPDAGHHGPHVLETMGTPIESDPGAPLVPVPAQPQAPTPDPFADTVNFLEQNSKSSRPRDVRKKDKRMANRHVGRPKATAR